MFKPEGINSLYFGCFNNCSLLSSIHLPINLMVIDRQCFYNCVNLNSIVLPKSLKEIDESCFKKCTSLHRIVCTDNIKRKLPSYKEIIELYN